MKKTLLITLIMLLMCMLIFSACDSDDVPSDNNDGNGTTSEECQHTAVTDPRVEPTFTSTGLTEGSHCGACGKILVAQDVIPMLPSKTTLMTDTLSLDGRSISGNVSYTTETFNFTNDITVTNNSPWVVSIDSFGMQTVATKSVPLNEGDNVFYIHVTNPDQTVATYTVNIYRNHLYTVSFNANGGTSVPAQQVEEGDLAEQPTTTRVGYTFASWDYDFTAPVTSNITVNANWNANGDTPYRVEYYYENLTKTGFDQMLTVNKTGETDTIATVITEPEDHFVLDTGASILSGEIHGDGSLVLKVYYTRNMYSVTTKIGENSSNLQWYPYGTEISLMRNITERGYDFKGWYLNGKVFSDEDMYIGKISGNIEESYEIWPELSNFFFEFTDNSCLITGVRDKTIKELIVPDYVTNIELGAFSGCSFLEEITIPFIGESRDCTRDSRRFGYIFGRTYYSNSIRTDQFIGGTDTSQAACYYIPSSLKSVTITGGVVGFGTFYNCGKITSVMIGDNVTCIEGQAFEHCTSLTSIIIGNGVERIGYYSFYECSNLKSVVIGNSVTSIEFAAFSNCSSLTSINYRGTKTQWDAVSKGRNWNYETGNYTIIYNYTGE